MIRVKEVFSQAPKRQHHLAPISTHGAIKLTGESLGQTVFARTPDDYRLASSMEQLEFFQIMEVECHQDSSKSWVAPLPFRSLRQRLLNYKKQALDHLVSLQHSLEKQPQMRAHFLEFMEKMHKRAHAEVALPIQPNRSAGTCPGLQQQHVKWRSVAQQVLLTGPDFNNSLLGILMRFRKEQVAITPDIEHMFHCCERGCFLWYSSNDLTLDILDYRMRVHLVPSPTPAVAVYDLRRAVKEAEADYGSGARRFVDHEFYVDDAL